MHRRTPAAAAFLRPRLTALGFVLACGLLSSAAAQGVWQSPERWTTDAGEPFQVGSLQGRPTVLTMAYGACRRICSTSLRLMEGLQALAERRGHTINFVVLGLDASQDRPQDWAAFRAEHKLKRSNWFFLSAADPAVQQAARQLGVRYWRYGDHTMHDFRIVLLSPQGQVLRSIETFDADLARLLPDTAPATRVQ